MVSNIPEIERLEQMIGELEAYEKPMTSEQCHNAINVLQALTALVSQRAEEKCQQASSAIQRACEMVAFHYAREKAKEARVQLAAFAPICHNLDMQTLHRRQRAAFRLSEFAQAATEALAQQKAIPTPRPRPDYLRLVEPDSERTDGQEGVDA